MSDITAASLSRQSGLMHEISIIANNMANAGTVGFKREASLFTEYVQGRGDAPRVSMASLRAHFPDMATGSFAETNGTYDLAIAGDGFFAVQTSDGLMLTRNGQFQRDMDGQLVTSEGYPVLDDGGGAIEIPPNAARVQFSADGTMSVDGLAQAQLGIFAAPAESLVRRGGNLWQPTDRYAFIDEPHVKQGFLEQSNVNPVLEMARLIEAQRLFEAGQTILEQNHQRQEQMIRDVGSRA